MMAPAIGLRFGRQRGIFSNVHFSVPFVIGQRIWNEHTGTPDEVITSSIRFGFGLGYAW
jgi:hypothetical protein